MKKTKPNSYPFTKKWFIKKLTQTKTNKQKHWESTIPSVLQFMEFSSLSVMQIH